MLNLKLEVGPTQSNIGNTGWRVMELRNNHLIVKFDFQVFSQLLSNNIRSGKGEVGD